MLILTLCLSITGCGKLIDAFREGVEDGIGSVVSSLEPEISGVQETDDSPEEDPEEDPDEPASTAPNESIGEVAYEITYAKASSYLRNSSTVWVQVIIEVENTGSARLYLDSGAYDLEDANGKLIKSVSYVSVYPDVIEPGEKAYYYEETSIDDFEKAVELEILPRVDIKKATVDKIRLSVSDDVLSEDGYGDLKILGRVENTTDEELSYVYVVVVLFDSNDIPLGLFHTTIPDTLAPGDKVGFEGISMFLPASVTLDSVSRYEVFAYMEQYQY